MMIFNFTMIDWLMVKPSPMPRSLVVTLTVAGMI